MFPEMALNVMYLHFKIPTGTNMTSEDQNATSRIVIGIVCAVHNYTAIEKTVKSTRSC